MVITIAVMCVRCFMREYPACDAKCGLKLKNRYAYTIKSLKIEFEMKYAFPLNLIFSSPISINP